MCVCLYIHTNTCIFVYICIYVHIYAYTHIYVYVGASGPDQLSSHPSMGSSNVQIKGPAYCFVISRPTCRQDRVHCGVPWGPQFLLYFQNISCQFLNNFTLAIGFWRPGEQQKGSCCISILFPLVPGGSNGRGFSEPCASQPGTEARSLLKTVAVPHFFEIHPSRMNHRSKICNFCTPSENLNCYFFGYILEFLV